MALGHLLGQFSTLSTAMKIGIAVAVLAVAGLLIGGTFGISNFLHNRSYEKREAQREAERAQLESEKATLQAEKQKALTEAAEAKASADAFKTVAESKRADRSTTAKELDAIEKQHIQRKAEVEAAGGTLSDDALRRALCERLAKRGYPPCPD